MKHVLIVCCLVLGCASAHAASVHRFIFWHPGEARTTAQAQPLLDLFGVYLARKMPDTAWEIKYFSTEAEGKRNIQQQRPAFGIVSHLMLERHGAAFGMHRLLATRPLPHGQGEERWYLLAPSPCTLPRITTIHVTEPFTAADLKNLFPALPVETVTVTANLLHTLQQLAATDRCASALVSARVWTTLQHAGPWVKRLTAHASSHPTPTPSVVQFPRAAAQIATRVEVVLRGMASDPEGHALLTELRLAGFAHAR